MQTNRFVIQTVKIFAMIKDCTIQFFFVFVENEVLCEEFYIFQYPSLATKETATSKDECKNFCAESETDKKCYYNWKGTTEECLIDYDVQHKCIGQGMDGEGWELTNSACPFPWEAAVIGGLLLVGFLGAIVYAYRTSKTIEA